MQSGDVGETLRAKMAVLVRTTCVTSTTNQSHALSGSGPGKHLGSWVLNLVTNILVSGFLIRDRLFRDSHWRAIPSFGSAGDVCRA